MKNRTSNIFSILLLCMCSSLSFAQFQLEGYLGGNLGMNATYVLKKEERLTNTQLYKMKYVPLLGVSTSISGSYFFNAKWGISSAISFNQFGFKRKNDDTGLMFNYLGIPLTGKYNLNKNAQFSFALQGHYLADFWFTQSGKIARVSGFRDAFKDFGLSADMGFNYYFSKFIIRAAYSHFITGYQGIREYTTITTSEHLHAFSLSVGYRFLDKKK